MRISYALFFVWQTCGSYLSALRPKVNETIKRKWRPSISARFIIFLNKWCFVDVEQKNRALFSSFANVKMQRECWGRTIIKGHLYFWCTVNVFIESCALKDVHTGLSMYSDIVSIHERSWCNWSNSLLSA